MLGSPHSLVFPPALEFCQLAVMLFSPFFARVQNIASLIPQITQISTPFYDSISNVDLVSRDWFLCTTWQYLD